MKVKNLISVSIGMMGSFSINSYSSIEEIIVTAQKRAESQQDVPIAINTLTSDGLQAAGITNTDDLGVVTPGLQVSQGGIAAIASIRGIITQDATGGQDSPVATYVDGVWYGSVTGSALSFNNIERIEVLKGPQGTLFGRNTTGGVINIITKDPSHEPELNVSVGYGNYETARYSLYGSTGITDQIVADMSVDGSDQNEGFSDNLSTGKDVNKRQGEINVRTKWKYTGDTTTATLSLAYENYSDDMGYVRGAAPGTRNLAGDSFVDEWDIQNDSPAYADFENFTASLRIDKSFQNFDFVSITAYKDDFVDSLADTDTTSAYILNADIDFYTEYVSQEFQFLSNSPDSALTWIGGLYFLDQEGGSDITITGPALWGFGLNDQRFFGDIDTTSMAAFGETAYEFTELTRLTLGLRYTIDEREITGGNQFYLFTNGEAFSGLETPVIPTMKQDDDWEELTWRIVLDHQFSDEIMGYISYNRGFRSGNYNAVAPDGPAFDPEIVDAYEIGFKSDLLDRTLRLNASAYYYEIEDLQFQVLKGVTTQIVNAAKAEIKGLEMDLIWAATDALELTLGTSYMDGEYKEFPNATVYTPTGFGNDGGTVQDVSGNPVAGSPEWFLTSGATYKLVTDSGEYSFNFTAAFNDGFPWEADGRLVQDEYTIVNLSAGWRDPSDRWGIRLNAKNVLDEDYSVTTRSQAGFGDFYAPAAPFTYYIMVDYSL